MASESDGLIDETVLNRRVILSPARCAEPFSFLFTIRQVRQMISRNPVTPVPFAPDWLRGVAALDGVVAPALSLEILMGLPGPEIEPARRHLVLRSSGKIGHQTRCGLVEAGPAVGIQTFPEDTRPAHPDDRIRRPEFIRGLFARSDGSMLLIPDINRILAAP